MSVAALSTTTLSAALDASTRVFAVASTTGINAQGVTTVGSVLVVRGEAMLVQRVPVSGTVEVIRGFANTAAKAHPSGARVYHAARTAFAFAETGGAQPQGLVGLRGDPGTLPEYRLPLGARVRDEAGAEYVLCDFTATVHSGVTVSISNDGNFSAAVLTSGHQGAVGVVAEPTSSSDTWGWVQVYGYTSAQEAGGTSAGSSAYMPIIAGSVSSPAAGMAVLIATTSTPQLLIYGMFVVGAATTTVTSAASHTGVAVPVFLNYPYVYATATDVGFS